MHRTPAIFLLIAVVLTAWFAAPDLSSGFRAEDFLDFDTYGRNSGIDCLTKPHLGIVVVSFYRPVSDLCTWCLVRGVGPDPYWIHAILLLLHILTLGALLGCARSLLDLSLGVSVAVVGIAACHPYANAVLLYLDGGLPQILWGLFALASLWSLGCWRRGQASFLTLSVWTLLGMLSFDSGLVLPLLLVAIAWLLPRQARPAPYWLLVWIPVVLLLRTMVLGTPLGGYGLPLTPEFLGNLARGFLHSMGDLWVPALHDFPEDVHSRVLSSVALVIFLATVLGGVLARKISRRRSSQLEYSARASFRTYVALLVLLVGIFAPAAIEIMNSEGAKNYIVPLLAYRLYPAVLAYALLMGWTLRGFSSRGGWPCVVLVVPWLATCLFLGAPIRAGVETAGQQAAEIQEQLIQHSQSAKEKRPTILFATPMSVMHGPRPMARLYQYGLSSACRPPMVDSELLVYPVLKYFDGNASTFVGDFIASAEALATLAASSWCDALQYDPRNGRIIKLPSINSPDSGVAGPELQLLPPSAQVPDAKDAQAWQKAEEVKVSSAGEITLGVRGSAPGLLQLVVFNRIHPYFVADLPFARLHLQREEGLNGSTDTLHASAPQLLEIARRFPGDVSFAVLQASSASGTAVSNLLPIRLVEHAD